MSPLLLHIIARAMMALVFVFAIADCFTTNLALKLPGVVEANPVMAFFQRLLQDKWVLARLGLALVIIAASIGASDKVAAITFGLNNLLMVYVIYSNVSLIIAKSKPA